MVALVTGGGRGIGQVVALRLAKEGWTVAVSARSADQLQATVRKSEGRILAIAADVGDPESVKSMVREAEQKLGSLDLLVNNAAAAGPMGAFWENDPGEWWHCQEVNLRGPMLCCHHALPGMLARKSGRIVNVASGAGCQAVPGLSAYVASKTALIRFSEQLAIEVQPFGVAVFVIHPGVVRTAMSEKASQAIPLIQALLDTNETLPDVPADLIVFLASGRADRLSGHYFSVDEDASEITRRASDVLESDLYFLRMRTLSL
jgi:NAD(P)-dependent dehydrogenase (short-subunit alcohol dehydrogenase family)